MKDIKAIFFDIDGTLVYDHNQYTASTLDALHALKQKGILTFIASGRPKDMIDPLRDILPFAFDGYIALNGQYCFLADETIIRQEAINTARLLQGLEFLKAHNIGTFIVDDERTSINFCDGTQTQDFLDMAPGFPIYDPSHIDQHPVLQIMPHIHDDALEQELLDLLEDCKGRRWQDVSTDIVKASGGKNAGIDAMLAHFHIPLSQTMAFGDGENDIDMLTHVPFSVAMGNADPEVKAVASYITTDVTQDGIAHALKHFHII